MRWLTDNAVRLTLATSALVFPMVAAAQSGAGDFVLLTEKDGPLGSLAQDQSDLPSFLNAVYTLVIGVAVVLAVLQIVRGGILWMLTDSFTEKNQARHLVTISVMGLVLVLSPVIVFNIINPCILSLSLTGSTRGNTECEGSLDKLPPLATGAPDTGSPASQLREVIGSEVSYGIFISQEKADEFISRVPMCAEHSAGPSEIGNTGTYRVICHNNFDPRAFGKCTLIPDQICSVDGFLDPQAATNDARYGNFISQCQAAGGIAYNESFLGDIFDIEISRDMTFEHESCEEEEERAIRASGRYADDAHIGCDEIDLTCSIR